ncbi:MAG TPA: histidine kinase [Pseudonocardia sp.]|nr:histidine kinase [Pseudonocardia sp.]
MATFSLSRYPRERDAADVRAAESHAIGRRILESENSIRRQITRDLHDGAQQRLVSLLIGLQEVRAELDSCASRAIEMLDREIGELQTATDELRKLVGGTYPWVLTTRGLRAALEDLAAGAAIPVSIEGELAARLPEPVEVCAHFTVAEAVTNTIKHARASRVCVSISVAGSMLSVVVIDDGVGGATLSPHGSGLVGLSDRAATLDGCLSIASPPGAGTTLELNLPTGVPTS